MKNKNRIYVLTFLFLLIGVIDFWVMDYIVLSIALGALALLNISVLWFFSDKGYKSIDVSIQLSNAIMTGAAAYIYYQSGDAFLKWIWGVLCFFYLLLSLLLILGAGDKKG
ncbi:hypothetical protein AB9P05_08210 [Roseivirga sp. BDSF3-8]|uniref:hypothetical protein n=1 Tax=Roseivirga sp. BDSF3-8 TaxID=3241598 RepID=UPI003531EB08